MGKAEHDYMRALFRNLAARDYGIIQCFGPDGEYYEARSQREACEMTGVSKGSVYNALKFGSTPRGWRFVREQDTAQPE